MPPTATPPPPLPDRVDTWIFDLDNTLYRATPGMLAQIDELMGSFISDFLGIDRDEAHRVQKAYFRSHGLTLRGLMVEHDLDPQIYIDHLSELDLSEIRPDRSLADAVDRLPGRKIIHTNAFTAHTREVLDRLGMAGHFDAIYDIGDAGYVPKPHIEPYRRLCDLHDVEPNRTVMIDDISRNLEPAAALGMTTVWVRTETHWAKETTETEHIDHIVDDLAGWLGGADGAPADATRSD